MLFDESFFSFRGLQDSFVHKELCKARKGSEQTQQLFARRVQEIKSNVVKNYDLDDAMSAITLMQDESKLLTDLSSFHKQCRTSDDEKHSAMKQPDVANLAPALESEQKPVREVRHQKFFDRSVLQFAPASSSIPSKLF